VTESSRPSGLSVVIPTYCRAYLLPEVVRPFLDDDTAKEIIIVDDGSSDETQEVCARMTMSYPKISSLQQDNAGEAAARLTGAMAASESILLFIDDDVIAEPGLASKHLLHHSAGPPRVVLGYMPIVIATKRHRGEFPAHIYAHDYESTCAEYGRDSSYVLEKLWGGNFSAPRAIFTKLQPPARDIPYHADQVLGWTLRDLGCTGVFDRDLLARHCYERTPSQFFHDAERRGTALSSLSFSGTARRPESPLDYVTPLLVPPVKAAASLPATVTNSVLNVLISLSGYLKMWSLETGLAKLLRHVCSQRWYLRDQAARDGGRS
jgi:glycosyltransferase involved in cell wall biosynthesis